MNNVGVGTRTINFLVDIVVIIFLSYLANRLMKWYFLSHQMYIPFRFGTVFFATLFTYYFLFELIFARTLGKWMSYTKVVNHQNKKPNIFQIFVRSAVRLTIIDMFFFPFLDKTLHDYLSKTNVVEA